MELPDTQKNGITVALFLEEARFSNYLLMSTMTKDQFIGKLSSCVIPNKSKISAIAKIFQECLIMPNLNGEFLNCLLNLTIKFVHSGKKIQLLKKSFGDLTIENKQLSSVADLIDCFINAIDASQKTAEQYIVELSDGRYVTELGMDLLVKLHHTIEELSELVIFGQDCFSKKSYGKDITLVDSVKNVITELSKKIGCEIDPDLSGIDNDVIKISPGILDVVLSDLLQKYIQYLREKKQNQFFIEMKTDVSLKTRLNVKLNSADFVKSYAKSYFENSFLKNLHEKEIVCFGVVSANEIEYKF